MAHIVKMTLKSNDVSKELCGETIGKAEDSACGIKRAMAEKIYRLKRLLT